MDESTLNDLLECSVCLERLDTSSKVLPCQHTFCRKCLEVIVSSRQELRCPECRILVDIKIDDLPPNVLLMRILEGMKNAAAAKTQQQLQNQQQDSPKIQNDNKVESTLKLNEEQQQQIKLKQLLYYQQQQQQYKQKQIHLQSLHQQQIQQTQQQPSHNSNNGPTPSAPPQRRPVPHAYALYDFDSNESSDLHFKKGDIILLKRKVDINWYVGELNGVEGTFPTNYVQVIVPLPSPQCIALYDFKMGPNEEEGCLTFKKGTLIHVLRRVDHNWAEGRIGSTIGIFPIAFVELNPLAKQLLDSFVVLNSPPPPPTASQHQQQQQQQQQQPNTPQNPPNTTPSNNLMTQHQQPRNLPPIPSDANTPDSTSSSSSRSSQTSPNSATNSSCSSSSTSLPSSPNQSNPTSPQNTNGVRYRDCKEKRHSLNALLSNSTGGVGPSLSIVQSNRHSAEILSVPSDLSAASVGVQNLRMRSSNDALLSTQTIASASNISTAPHTAATREQQQTGTSRVNVLKTSGQQNFPPTLPWGYLALYPYKPLKSDELELKKGCVYVVTERCLDGWFKGKNWQDISGVFPGNYVTPLRNRDQQQLMHQWKVVQNHVPLQNTTVQAAAPQNKLHVATNLSHQPPELPPRQSPSSSPSATASASSVWSKPLGQTVEAFFLRKTHNSQEQEPISKDKDREKQKDNNATGSSSAAVSLMKRLTQIKTRSKSPNNATLNNAAASVQQPANATNSLIYSIDNPSFEDTSSSATIQQGTAHLNQSHGNMHPVHVRSGSCPSQLLQSLPTDLLVPQKSDNNMAQHPHKQQHCSSQATYGSQRVKGCKERPQLQNIRHTADGTFRGVYNNTNNTTSQPQQSLSKCSQQAQQQSNFSNIAIHHRKSQSLDANTISAHMNTNGTAAEAGRAAPTMPNVRESRFRCVVSYPPNSELELELHVGDIVYVHRKQKHGWYKGTHARTNKTGLFPASFVEPDI